MKHRTTKIVIITLFCILAAVIGLFVAASRSWDKMQPVIVFWQDVLHKMETEAVTEADTSPDETALEASSEDSADAGTSAERKAGEARDGESLSALEAETETEAVTEAESEEKTHTVDAADAAALPVTQIYSFLQGPKAWNSKTIWSGEWCNFELADSLFSIFGCGLCDLANIYSTVTPYECSPVDMYYYASEVSGYSPDGGAGAIDWTFMRKVLRETGFTGRMHAKDPTYEQFQNQIKNSVTAIVLISSYNDDTYWTETPGHYVNIWQYDEEKDTVFLADSGNARHNRKRIPLRYIYDALSSESLWQYLLITGYDEEKNTWKYSGIDEKWTRPMYLPAK